MAARHDVVLADGRHLSVHDSGGEPSSGLTVVWHTGSPQTGALIAPVVEAAERRGVRLVSYGRPGYADSTRRIGRDVASAASDVDQFTTVLGVDRFAVMGASGGGPHALSCAALLRERVVGAVTFAGIAPFTPAFDWFGGMQAPGGLRSALAGGVGARERFAETDDFDAASFVARDWKTLEGPWSALGEDAQAAGRAGAEGLVDDDVAFTTPWGFDLAEIACPGLIVQGGLDRVVPRAHGEWLAGSVTDAELWLRPSDGHISVLEAVPMAFDWLLAVAAKNV